MGTIAAGVQSGIGNVVAGSAFAGNSLTECQMSNLMLNVCFDFFSRHENQIWK